MMKRARPYLQDLVEYVDAFPNWRTEPRITRQLGLYLSLAAAGNIAEYRPPAGLAPDEQHLWQVAMMAVLALLTSELPSRSAAELAGLCDAGGRVGNSAEARAIVASLSALGGEEVDWAKVDVGAPRDPNGCLVSEARYLATRKEFSDDDLVPWAVLLASSQSEVLVPGGVAMARHFGVAFDELFRETLKRVDRDLFLEGEARLEEGGFTGRLSAAGVDFDLELIGGGGSTGPGLATIMAAACQRGTLDAVLEKQARISTLGKGASLPKLRKTLSNRETQVRRRIILKGDLSVSETVLEPYRRRMESMHEWTKECHPFIEAGVSLEVAT